MRCQDVILHLFNISFGVTWQRKALFQQSWNSGNTSLVSFARVLQKKEVLLTWNTSSVCQGERVLQKKEVLLTWNTSSVCQGERVLQKKEVLLTW